MEACELHLAENPDPARLWHGSMAGLAKAEPDARIVPPAELPGSIERYFTPDFIGEWTSGTDMGTGDRVWVPSSAVYFYRRPLLFETNSNGLASGNTRAEARLHAMYELIERDAMCAMSGGGRLRLRDRGQRIDPDSVTFPLARLILDRWTAEGASVLLVALPAAGSRVRDMGAVSGRAIVVDKNPHEWGVRRPRQSGSSDYARADRSGASAARQDPRRSRRRSAQAGG